MENERQKPLHLFYPIFSFLNMHINSLTYKYIILYNTMYLQMKGIDFMLAVNYSTIRSKLKDYCDKVTDDYETVIVTRKDEKNVVLISLDEYNSLTKAARNAAYLNMIDRSMEQLARGDGKAHELIEVEDE